MRIVPWLSAGAIALALGCASSNTSSPSGTATAPTPAPAAGGALANVTGGIQNYTTGPGGQQNGFVLSSGQRVHFPEELGSKVSDQFPPNTQVQVSGRMIADSDGRQVLDADKITDPTRNLTLDLATLRAGTPPPSTGTSVGGSGAAGSGPMTTPPPTTEPQPGSLGTPPPGGK
ncbi:MAG TPA: hypothetical protein VFN91_03500 [Myxococcaceae bacterium]|nr:hypothetical protein [Myxococcaceae bacterium]